MPELITIASYTFRPEAEVDRTFLESQGIKAVIVADDAGGMRPYPFSYRYGVELKVLAKDARKAKLLLAKSSSST